MFAVAAKCLGLTTNEPIIFVFLYSRSLWQRWLAACPLAAALQRQTALGAAAVLAQPAVARPLAGPGHAHVHGAAVPPGGAAEPGRRAGGRPPRQRGVPLPLVPLPVPVPGEAHLYLLFILLQVIFLQPFHFLSHYSFFSSHSFLLINHSSFPSHSGGPSVPLLPVVSLSRSVQQSVSRSLPTRADPPWLSCRDNLLLEAGFLCVLVAPLTVVRGSRGVREHDPVTFWLVRWLLFRLMFASGVVKLTSRCPTWWGLTGQSVCVSVCLIPIRMLLFILPCHSVFPQRSPTTTRPSASPRRRPGSPTSCPCGGRS